VRKSQDLLELEDGTPGVRLTTDHSRAPARANPSALRADAGAWPRLVGSERALGAVAGAGLLVGAQAVTTTIPLLVPALSALGVILALPAVLGRAPRWLKGLLATLTGGAP